MAKPSIYLDQPRKAALFWSAALALCLLLVFGLLWPVPVSFAASDEPVAAATEVDKAETPRETAAEPKAPVNNVVVETPTALPAPGEPEAQSQPQPQPEPTVPETPVIPDYEYTWPIGADEASTVVAELWADGTFVVDGAGAALAFDGADDVPWLAAGAADDIERVIFADKVEAESLAHWFEGCKNLAEIADVPAGVKDLTRAFYDCPKLAELPDTLAFGSEAKAVECFGFSVIPEELLVTAYCGDDAGVLAYDWAADARVLVNPDAPEPVGPPVDGEDPIDPEAPNADGTGDPETDAENGTADTIDPEAGDPETAADSNASADPEAEGETVPEPAENALPEEHPQLNITVPSSVTMALNVEGENTATIPVMVANRSEQPVAITGARLKRSGQDLPGGSWSLTTESGATTFVQDARFTPLGLEATFDRSVVLAAGDEGTMLVWHGSFTDYGMKTLVNAVIEAGDEGFAYGSMIWIVSAA